MGKYCQLHSFYEQQQNRLNQGLTPEPNPAIDSGIFLQTPLKVNEIDEQRNRFYDYLSKNYCPPDQINMQLWWQDHWEYIFISLSVIFIFTLLIAGTYLLINNLAQEEHRGTLNFIRLTPQSETSILTGKILGVPILIYIFTLTAVPLHLWAGYSANIAFSYILSFYAVLTASCILFYSAALLFGLVSRGFSGFQPWLGSGLVLVFLTITMLMASNNLDLHNSSAWFRLLSPFEITASLFPGLFHRSAESQLQELQFFQIPIGKSLVSLVIFHIGNYALWTYWIWQGLQRSLRNPNAAIISKAQSYLLVGCFQVILWGFTLQSNWLNYQVNEQIFVSQQIFNLVLLFVLMLVLSPHRQTIQDWSKYRFQKTSSSHFWKNSLLPDLIFGEKSPALVAMAINLVIVTTPLLICILLAPILDIHHNGSENWLNNDGMLKAILAVALLMTLMMIYATLAQRILLITAPKRSLWATGIIGALVLCPPTILKILNVLPAKEPMLWLFSSFPWIGIQYVSTTTIFMTLLGQLSILGLLTFELTRQVRLAGESATKSLLAASVKS